MTDINWGTEDIFDVDWANARIVDPVGFPPEANLRIAAQGEGLVLSWDAFDAVINWKGGFIASISNGPRCAIEVPFALRDGVSLTGDARTIRSKASFTFTTLGGFGIIGTYPLDVEVAGLSRLPVTAAQVARVDFTKPPQTDYQPALLPEVTASVIAALAGPTPVLRISGPQSSGYGSYGPTLPVYTAPVVSGPPILGGSTAGDYVTTVHLPADSMVVQFSAITQESVGGGTPSVLHFRDPADGVFKPLTEVRVPGFDDPPAPDLSDAVIGWGTERVATLHDPTLFTPPPPGYGTAPAAMPAEANARASILPNGRIRIQADSWTYNGTAMGGFMQSQDPHPVIAVRVPITWDPGIGTGEEMVRLLWTLKNNAGGSVPSGQTRTVGYTPVSAGLAKPGDDNAMQPNPKDYIVPAVGAESNGLGVQDILGHVAVQHDHVVVTFWPKYQEAPYADGSHPLTATLPALDIELDYLLVRQVAVLP